MEDRLHDLEHGEGEETPAEQGANHAPALQLQDEIAESGQVPPTRSGGIIAVPGPWRPPQSPTAFIPASG